MVPAVLALFNLGIDNKLRGCDLVSLRVSEIAPRGYAVDATHFGRRMTCFGLTGTLVRLPASRCTDAGNPFTGQLIGSRAAAFRNAGRELGSMRLRYSLV